MDFIADYHRHLNSALATLDLDKVRTAIEWFQEARAGDRQIFVCGNGGSGSTASHFVNDMVKGASYGRPRRFRILALTDSVSTITAYSNDIGYDIAFVEQLKNFARPDDLVLALSSSGESPSVLRTLEYANSIGCRTIALTGRDGGKLGPLGQLHINVPGTHTGRIEDAHLIILHMICYYFIDTEE
jgi:D-sedoheptulose 7-phosphate isomerase